MFGVPLHPALVHLPLALAMFAPLVAAVAAWFFLRGGTRQAWLVAVSTLALTVVTGFVSMQTGEADEERVERVVAERTIESHEDAAKLFVAGAGVALLVALGAWASRSGALRGSLVALTVAGSVAVAGLAVRTGHSGGSLVYVHGAASAHVQAAGAPGAAVDPIAHNDDDDD